MKRKAGGRSWLQGSFSDSRRIKNSTPPGFPGRVEKSRAVCRGLLASGDVQHLAAFVVTAGRASNVAGDGSAALRAALEDGGAPAIRTLTEALAALGLSAFWIGHVLKGVAISIDRGHSRLRGLHQALQPPENHHHAVRSCLRQDSRAGQRYHLRSAGSSEGIAECLP